MTNVKGLELRMVASEGSEVVGHLAGFTFVVVETELDGFLKVHAPALFSLFGRANVARPGSLSLQS